MQDGGCLSLVWVGCAERGWQRSWPTTRIFVSGQGSPPPLLNEDPTKIVVRTFWGGGTQNALRGVVLYAWSMLLPHRAIYDHFHAVLASTVPAFGSLLVCCEGSRQGRTSATCTMKSRYQSLSTQFYRPSLAGLKNRKLCCR